MELDEKIQADLVQAMRAQELVRLGTLRMVKAALKQRLIEKTVPLSEAEAHAVLETLIKQRREASEQFRKGGRAEMAEKEEQEIQIIAAYLPAFASEEEIDRAIASAIATTGAQGPKDMGRVMKAVFEALEGQRIDRGKVSAKVKSALDAAAG